MSTETEVKGEDISVTVSEEAGCRVTLDVCVSPEQTRSFYKKALKAINKEVSLPGFRKGRAPDAMIEKNYKSHLEREWQENLVRESFEFACESTNLYPLGRDSLEKPSLSKCSREEGAELQFKFEREPNVPEVKAVDLKVSLVAPKEVTAEQVESTIQDIRTVHANWEAVEGRGIQEGDYVDLDIESLEEPGQMICKDKRFEVAKGKIGEWMKKLLIGLKKGDTVEAVSELEDGQAEEIKNFKPTKCKITVNEIQDIQLPELTDELAQKVGKESVDVLRAAIQEDLVASAKRDALEKMKDQLDDLLVESYDFDLPASLVEAERQVRLKYRIQQLKQDKLSEEEIKAKESEFETEVEKEVSRALRLHFLVNKVAQDASIDISQEELLNELSRQMWGVPPEERIVHQGMTHEEIRSRIVSKIINDKAREYLLEQITGSSVA